MFEQVATVAGRFSVGAWTMACLYQICKCYLSGDAFGFSPLFLVGYLVGDVFNVVGTFWGNQLGFQRAIAVCALVADTVLALQVFYLSRKPGDRAYVHAPGVQAGAGGHSSASRIVVAASLAGVAQAHGGGAHQTRFLIGQTCGWIAEIVYVCSMAPQVLENHRNKSTGGVSVFLFVADLLGNVAYLVTIASTAVHVPDARAFLLKEGAFIFGPTCSLVFDLVILMQFGMYDKDVEVIDALEESRLIPKCVK